MSALLILNYDVHDEGRLQRYRSAASPILLADGAADLLVSTEETHRLAESSSAGTHTVVLRFGSVDDARRVYQSQEYEPMLTERLEATTPRFAVIVPTSS